MRPVRGAALARGLLGLGGVTGAIVAFTACSCDFTETRPVSEQTYRDLHARYGAGLLDSATCASLCETGGGSSPPPSPDTAGQLDTGGSSVVVQDCRLVRIDWREPGVHCRKTDTQCAIGRRPAGLGPLTGARFARVARLEAASVVAFLRLAHDLERLGAPSGLVAAAVRAAADEDRHAALTLALARRAGVEPEPVTVAAVGPRPLVEIACENVVEGCVGETLGAIEAARDARHDPDPEVRRAMAQIAADEAAHAALAWAVHDWAWARLSPGERRRVRRAHRRAVAPLRAAGRWPAALEGLTGGLRPQPA